jgi:uncharacterized repeat protein (TIGR01451 family)
MSNKPLLLSTLALAGLVLLATPARAEQHRATHLGHPATRFAPTMYSPADLRARFRDEKLRPDIAEILRQWGWTGNLEDLHRAALTAEISEVQIPVGDTMPFMSSRENGKPICLRNVLWAGKEPISAYAFNFTSNSRRYRCVTPKPCSNFFLEDLGPEPKAALAIECSAPEKILAGRPAQICLTVRNTGNVAAGNIAVTLPVPAGATVTGTTDGGAVANGNVTWQIADLAPNTGKQVCAVLKSGEPGTLAFTPTARSASAPPAQSDCATKVIGVTAILLEVVDVEDPIEVGKEVNYVIKVTNQGSATGTNIKLICTLPASQEFVSATGATAVQAAEKMLTMSPLPALAPKAAAEWRVMVKAGAEDDARFKVELSSDQFALPIHEDEATQQY